MKKTITIIGILVLFIVVFLFLNRLTQINRIISKSYQCSGNEMTFSMSLKVNEIEGVIVNNGLNFVFGESRFKKLIYPPKSVSEDAGLVSEVDMNDMEKAEYIKSITEYGIDLDTSAAYMEASRLQVNSKYLLGLISETPVPRDHAVAFVQCLNSNTTDLALFIVSEQEKISEDSSVFFPIFSAVYGVKK